jgi:hypothetical protein
MTDRAAFHIRRRKCAAELIGASFLVIAMVLGGGAAAVAQQKPGGARADACAADNGGITLSPGFCATVFADNVGHARQMAFGPSGVLYVNTWSGRYYHNDKPPPGGFLVALKDNKGDGHADRVERFGDGVAQGSAGGTGIRIYKDGLYAEQNDKIIRYGLPSDGIVPKEQPQVILSGLPLTGDHPMHPFIIDADGQMFVDLGSATNSCQLQNRIANSPGHQPCTELETRAGVWLYEANKKDQRFSASERYACATGRDSHSIPPGVCSSRSTAATSFRRIGRASLPPSKAPNFRPRKSCSWKRAPIMAGRSAITTDWRTRSSWRRNMAETARLSESAPAKTLPSHRCPGIGLRTIC